MKKFLNSYTGFFVVCASMFFCSYTIIYSMSVSFRHYANSYFGWRTLSFIDFASFLGTFCLMPLAVMLYICTSNLIGNGKFTLWRKVKMHWVVVVIISVFVEIFLMRLAYEIPFLCIIVFPPIAFAIGVLCVTKIVDVLVWDKKIEFDLFEKFYKMFPVKEKVGGLVTSIAIAMFFMIFANGFFSQLLQTIICGTIIVLFMTKLAKQFISMEQESTTKYNQMLEEKIKAEHLKTELITNVSHDIKTPLTSIINYTDLLNQDVSHEQMLEYVQVISSKSQRLKALIEDLIEASKAGTGNIAMEKEVIDLCEITGQICGEFDEQMESKGLNLVMDIKEPPMNIFVDGKYFWRVLENLFSNVIKYSMKGTRVYVGLARQNYKYAFYIKNISAEQLNISPDELTQQFVRGDRSRHTEGSGLGLYIARSLTQTMGGEFNIGIHGDMFEVQLCFDPVREEI